MTEIETTFRGGNIISGVSIDGNARAHLGDVHYHREPDISPSLLKHAANASKVTSAKNC